MNTSLSLKNGKFTLNKIDHTTLEVISQALEKHIQLLNTLSETLEKEDYYKDYSIATCLYSAINKKLSDAYIKDTYSQKMHLHDLFVLYRAISSMQTTSNDHTRMICRSLVMLIHPKLPRTKETREVKIYSDLWKKHPTITLFQRCCFWPFG